MHEIKIKRGTGRKRHGRDKSKTKSIVFVHLNY